MKISVLQPEIVRGDINYNLEVIQSLVSKSKGELLILPEYVLTGSLVLDSDADINDWVIKCEKAKSLIKLPRGKKLIINTLVKLKGDIYNCCELLPSKYRQFKLYPDKTELDAGIKFGEKQETFEINNKKFKIIICTDLKHIEKISTQSLSLIIFAFHFTESNFEKVMDEVKTISYKRELPIIVSSLVSDKNCGFSSYVYKNTVVSLPECEGILEITID